MGGRTWRDVRKGVMSEAKKSSRLQRLKKRVGREMISPLL